MELQEQKRLSRSDRVLSAAAGATVVSVPTIAMADAVADITGMVTNVGTIATAVTAVVITVLTVRLGVKTLNRMMTKS